MDSPGQVTSSSFPAQAVVELRARPPSDMVNPASNCRRVGVLGFALRFVLSLIIVLASCVSRPSRTRPSCQVLRLRIVPRYRSQLLGAGNAAASHQDTWSNR